ncbi:MAG: hypothetical protein HQL65_13615 [Magnetococcales bacterium]|nr:hypothetical protein [Magnetococcales bacterium]
MLGDEIDINRYKKDVKYLVDNKIAKNKLANDLYHIISSENSGKFPPGRIDNYRKYLDAIIYSKFELIFDCNKVDENLLNDHKYISMSQILHIKKTNVKKMVGDFLRKILIGDLEYRELFFKDILKRFNSGHDLINDPTIFSEHSPEYLNEQNNEIYFKLLDFSKSNNNKLKFLNYFRCRKIERNFSVSGNDESKKTIKISIDKISLVAIINNNKYTNLTLSSFDEQDNLKKNLVIARANPINGIDRQNNEHIIELSKFRYAQEFIRLKSRVTVKKLNITLHKGDLNNYNLNIIDINKEAVRATFDQNISIVKGETYDATIKKEHDTLFYYPVIIKKIFTDKKKNIKFNFIGAFSQPDNTNKKSYEKIMGYIDELENEWLKKLENEAL